MTIQTDRLCPVIPASKLCHPGHRSGAGPRTTLLDYQKQNKPKIPLLNWVIFIFYKLFAITCDLFLQNKAKFIQPDPKNETNPKCSTACGLAVTLGCDQNMQNKANSACQTTKLQNKAKLDYQTMKKQNKPKLVDEDGSVASEWNEDGCPVKHASYK